MFKASDPIVAQYEQKLMRYSRGFVRFVTEELTSGWGDIAKDPSQGYEKLRVLDALGIKKVKGKVHVPPFALLVQNYVAILDAQHVPAEHRILPALFLKRTRDGVTEWRTITPGVDPWPEEPDFEIQSKKDLFNLPDKVIMDGLRGRGRFPLLEANHDLFHFVAYARAPSFAKAMRQALAKLGPHQQQPASDTGFFFALELLSTADPRRKADIFAALAVPKEHGGGNPPYAAYEKCFARMSSQALLAYARKLHGQVDSWLFDYGGGVGSGDEKARFVRPGSPRTVLSLLLAPDDFDRASLIPQCMAAHTTVIEHLLEIRANPKLSQTGYIEDEVREYFSPTGKPKPAHKTQVDSLLRTYLARVEYALWESSTRMTAERWVDEVTHSVKPTAQVITFVRHVMGEGSKLYKDLIKDSTRSSANLQAQGS